MKDDNGNEFKPQCATVQVSTGRHCPEPAIHSVENEYGKFILCDKCHEVYMNREKFLAIKE